MSFECPKCKEECPVGILACCEGYCQTCAIDIFNVWQIVEKKLKIPKERRNYDKFAYLMSKIFDNDDELSESVRRENLRLEKEFVKACENEN